MYLTYLTCVLIEVMDTPPEVTTTLDTILESSIPGLSRPHWPSSAESLIVLRPLFSIVGLHILETNAKFVGKHWLLLSACLVSS